MLRPCTRIKEPFQTQEGSTAYFFLEVQPLPNIQVRRIQKWSNGGSSFCLPALHNGNSETLLIAIIGVEPTVKYSFVEKGKQMVRKGQLIQSRIDWSVRLVCMSNQRQLQWEPFVRFKRWCDLMPNRARRK